jgi:hypothetical protein
MSGIVSDPKFRMMPVTEHEVAFKMGTVTSQMAAHEESELMLGLQLQALSSLWSKFETFKYKQVSKKTVHHGTGVKDI